MIKCSSAISTCNKEVFMESDNDKIIKKVIMHSLFSKRT